MCVIGGIRIGSPSQVRILLMHLGEVNNWRQMALDEPLPNTHAMVEPKAKKKYKTKMKKEKDVAIEELMITALTMVGEGLLEEEAQSLKEYAEEATKPTPWKTKKNKTMKDEANPNKVKAHERILSFVKQRKKEIKVNMGSWAKTHNPRET